MFVGGAGIVHRKVFGVADNKGGAGGRGGLLSDIRSGKNLKKVEKEKAMKVGCEEGWIGISHTTVKLLIDVGTKH